MADLIYRISSKKLIWPSKGFTWNAVSGPYGKGTLPPGEYAISRRELTAYGAIDKPFQDSTGEGFFVPIYPKFKTTRGKTGGRLGIHPDGNVQGTQGCIGLSEKSREFFDALAATAPGADLILEVKW